jgi:hypothetical protein
MIGYSGELWLMADAWLFIFKKDDKVFVVNDLFEFIDKLPRDIKDFVADTLAAEIGNLIQIQRRVTLKFKGNAVTVSYFKTGQIVEKWETKDLIRNLVGDHALSVLKQESV